MTANRELSPKARTISILVGVAAAIAAFVYITAGPRCSTESRSAKTTEPPPTVEPAAESPRPDPVADAGRIKTFVKTPTSPRRKLHSPEARKAMAMAIDSARRRAHRRAVTAEASAATAERPELEPPPLDKDYIRDVMKDAVPLLAECYELSLEVAPDSEGTLTTTFVIAAEPEAGGYVELAEVDTTQMTGNNEVLAECVRETVYSLQFDAPESGGKTTVKYPLKFRQSDEDSE